MNRRSPSMIKHIIFIWFGLSSVLIAGYQTESWVIEQLSVEDGLSQSAGQAILQDRYGFMWIGTQDGLNRYDGNQFRIYKHNSLDPASLSDVHIQALSEDDSGYLWIGTESGLNRYDHILEIFQQFMHTPDEETSLSSNFISALHFNNGYLWVGTDNGLNCWDPVTHTVTRYMTKGEKGKGLTHAKINVIYTDQSDDLWVGTDYGLNRIHSGLSAIEHFTHDTSDPHSISHNHINTISEDAQGNLWIGTEHGLNRWEKKTRKFYNYVHSVSDSTSISHNRINSLHCSMDSSFWIATDNCVNRYNPETDGFIHYDTRIKNSEKIQSSIVTDIYSDRSGVTWLGVKGGGLTLLHPVKKQFQHIKNNPNKSNSLNDNVVYSLFEDHRGDIWIGTLGGGINQWDRNTDNFSAYKHNPSDTNSLSHNKIRSINEDKQHQLWIGTDGGGVNRFDPEKKSFFRYVHDPQNPSSLSHDVIRPILVDSRNRVWIGTYGGGLDLFDRQSDNFIHFKNIPADQNSLSYDYVYALYEDNDGIIWIGTDGGGLNKYNPESGEFARFQHDPENPSSLSNDYVLCILEDDSGTLWIGTDAALNRFDRSTGDFHSFDEKDGLPNSVIYGILEDDEGNLWMSHNLGISRYNPQTGTFTNFSISDGLQYHEFNGGAYHKNKNGEMFFGGFNGFNVFHPMNIHYDRFESPVKLTDIRLYNKSIPVGRCEDGRTILNKSISFASEVHLSHDDDMITFEFTSLDYIFQNQIEYSYIMKGFDTDWNHVRNQHTATYTNLPSGEFTFHVKAAKRDGEWSADESILKIHITPPFWQTYWFWAAFIGILIFILFLAYQYRTKTIRGRNKELERHVEERTLEIQNAKQEAEYRARQAALLYHIGHEVSSELNTSALLTKIVNSIQETFSYYRVALMLLNENGDTLKIQAIAGKDNSTNLLNMTVPVGKGLTGIAASQGKIQLVNDVSQNKDYVRIMNELTESELAVPIIIGQEKIGILDIQSDKKNAFTESDIEVINTLSTQIGSAIENARLYEKARREIEDRHEAEHALKLSEFKYRTLFNRVAEPVCIFEKNSHRFLDCNDAMIRKYGYTRKELQTMTPFDLHPPEDMASVSENIDEKNVEKGNIYTHLPKSGKPMIVEIHSDEIDYQGSPAWISVIRDITSMKETEAALRSAKQAADDANRAKSSFLANMSHEIRTPMNGIIGMADLALDTNLTEQQRKYLTICRQSAESLLTLLNEILDFSKLEARKMTLNTRDFNLRHLIENTVNSMAASAYEKGTELVHHIRPGVDLDLAGDDGRLRQILVNLLNNAIKFTERGEIILSVEMADEVATMALQKEKQTGETKYLRFSVSDTGIGIPEEQQDEIFESFTQADGSNTRKYGGTGLGLTITKELVELMGGHIWLESEQDTGSTFHFIIKLQKGRPVQDSVKTWSPPDAASTKILIVDDNTTNAIVLQEYLTGWGFPSNVAYNGKTALEMLENAVTENQRYQLVLTDFQMPGMDGFELSRQIRNNQDWRDIQIILITSVCEKTDESICREIGISGYLQKPIQHDSLFENIANCLDKAKQVQSEVSIETTPIASETGLRILLVEDDLVNQEVAVGVLEKYQHNVTLAMNGRDALEQLEHQDFDLVFMDVQMPVMDGFEATKAIRTSNTEYQQIPIIAMTAHALEGDRERCIEAGMNDYISKPLDAKEILTLIENQFA